MTRDDWLPIIAVLVLLVCVYVLGRYHGRWDAYMRMDKDRPKGRKR